MQRPLSIDGKVCIWVRQVGAKPDFTTAATKSSGVLKL
jgi:hypothetical protein